MSTTALEVTETPEAVQVLLADGTTICADQLVVAAVISATPSCTCRTRSCSRLKGQALEFAAAERGGRPRLHRQCYAPETGSRCWRTAYARAEARMAGSTAGSRTRQA